jgi:hypothetical protein
MLSAASLKKCTGSPCSCEELRVLKPIPKPNFLKRVAVFHKQNAVIWVYVSKRPKMAKIIIN